MRRGRGRRPARAAVCRIPCLILCLQDVKRTSMARRPVLTSRQRSTLFSLPPREADLRRHDTLPPTPKAEGGFPRNLSTEGILWRDIQSHRRLTSFRMSRGERAEQIDLRVERPTIRSASAPLVVAGGARLPEKPRPRPVPGLQRDDAVGSLGNIVQRHFTTPLPVSRAQRSTAPGEASTAIRR